MGYYEQDILIELRRLVDLKKEGNRQTKESNRLKRLELRYLLAHYGIDKDKIISNEELEDCA